MSTAPTKAAVGAGGLLAVLAWVVVEYTVVIACLEGDGGSPYTAYDSPRGALCRAGGGVVVHAVPVLALTIGIAVGVWLARRWHRRRLPAFAIVGAVLVPGMLTVGVPATVSLGVSGHCSEAKQMAVERWRQGGRIGPQPFDCEHY